MPNIKVEIVNKSHHPLPEYKTIGAAGLDLIAFLKEPITLNSLERKLIPTGLFMALPLGYEAQVRPRSGTALKKGLTLVNAPGTIDCDYRGEIMIPLINLSAELQTIEDGERIAQMIIAKYEQITWSPVAELLDETGRGKGGFGHTGAK